MSPILGRIARTDLGARRRKAQRSWASVTVAGRCTGEAQSAHGSSEVAHQVWVSWGSAQLSWTECSGLGQLGRVRTVVGPCGRPMCDDGLMDSWDRARGLGMQWLRSNHPFFYIRRASPWVFRYDRASSYTMKHKKIQRKDIELVGFNIQDQEWFEGYKEAVLGEIKGEVMNDSLMDHVISDTRETPHLQGTHIRFYDQLEIFYSFGLRLNQDKAETSSKELGECYGSWTMQWSGNRPRDLEGLNNMKRPSWTKCLAARRCKQEAQPAGRSSVGAQSRVCQLPELD
ncbi:hypothetical protein DY000_02010203 [Brassica cretica]|uniref:Uncharacterized protein n=1 Tax=Brassica cretica TaxID=69181 RepID=A0ABQ7CC23_BRACR|nr:hypothetical protein DY000_02010203 [Brassica cretica]